MTTGAQAADAALPVGRSDLAGRLSGRPPGRRTDTIATLADAARLRRLRPGDQLYGQGELVPLTLILAGYGIARRTTTDGHELMSGVAQPGVVFGYSGMASQHSSVESSP